MTSSAPAGAIMTKVYCSEAAVDTVYDCMRVVGIASYTKDLTPLSGHVRPGWLIARPTRLAIRSSRLDVPESRQ